MRQECPSRDEADGARTPPADPRCHGGVRRRNGMSRDGYLPGNLRVRRRARDWFVRLDAEDPQRDPAFAEDWVNLDRAGRQRGERVGRRGSSPRRPTGAAGIIPAVLHYALHYTAGRKAPTRRHRHPLSARRAGAIGSLYKERASISGAEVGCQGEVGSARVDGRGWAGRNPRRHTATGGERRGDRHGAQPGPHVRSRSAGWCRFRASNATRSRRARPSTRPAMALRGRRHPPGEPRPGRSRRCAPPGGT